jgi:hypothetical protein
MLIQPSIPSGPDEYWVEYSGRHEYSIKIEIKNGIYKVAEYFTISHIHATQRVIGDNPNLELYRYLGMLSNTSSHG